MKVPSELEGILVSTPDTLHGAVRFVGTRVFASQLFEYLLTGETLETFLDDFEGVGREQAEALVEWERRRLRTEFEAMSV